VPADRSVVAYILPSQYSRKTNSMDDLEDVLVNLFKSLRDDLRKEAKVGLALKAEGPDVTLRVRSHAKAGDERQPYFAVVVGVSDGAFRISYKPSGIPSAPRRVVIVSADSADQLLGLVRGYVEAERRRLSDYRG
jgi:hypothetical protein